MVGFHFEANVSTCWEMSQKDLEGEMSVEER